MKSFKSFKEWLFPNFFTQYHKEADTYKVDGKGILERFVEVCGEYFDDEVTPDIDNILDTLIDYDHNSAIYINYLWEMFGNFPYSYGVLVGLGEPTPENIQRWISEDTNYPRANYRKLMQYVLRLYKIRGSAEFFEIVARFFDVRITIEELTDFAEDEYETTQLERFIVNQSKTVPISASSYEVSFDISLDEFPIEDHVRLLNIILNQVLISSSTTISISGELGVNNQVIDNSNGHLDEALNNGIPLYVIFIPDLFRPDLVATITISNLSATSQTVAGSVRLKCSYFEEVTYPLISESGDNDGNVVATYNTNYDHDWDLEVSYGSQVSSSYIDTKMVWGETNCNRCDKVKVTIGYPISRIQWFKDQDPDGDGSKIKEATNQAFRKLINKFLPVHVIIAEWGEEVFGYNLTPATVSYDSLPGSITSGEITLTLPNY